MTNKYVSFISDADFEACVCSMLEKAENGRRKSVTQTDRNVIDPFAAIFSMTAFDLSPKNWLVNEMNRQADKTLTNALGDFHQSMLGHVLGWKSLPVGNQVDLVSDDRKIVAEIKNKHNTVTGKNLISLYNSLENIVDDKTSIYKGYTAYYVTILAGSPERVNKPFTPSDSSKGKQVAAKEHIRIVDGNTFYEIVTGKENALKEIFDALPKVISNITKKSIDDKFAYAQTLFNKAFIS